MNNDTYPRVKHQLCQVLAFSVVIPDSALHVSTVESEIDMENRSAVLINELSSGVES